MKGIIHTFSNNARLFIITVILILTFSQGAFAEDMYPVALGMGLEWNMDSRYNFAGGMVLGLDFNLGDSFAVGFTVTGSYNFFEIVCLEPAALFRWYFLGKGYTGFFLQADAGVFLIFEEGEVIPMILGGLRGGYRIPLGKLWYVEPYGRAGYPFAFGLGVMAGIRFPEKHPAENAAGGPEL